MAHWRAVVLVVFLCAVKLSTSKRIHTGGQKTKHIHAHQQEIEADSKVKVIPRITRAEKYALIMRSGQDPYGRMRERLQRRENRRFRHSSNGLRMRHRGKSLNVTLPPLLAEPMSKCPREFDAVTRGHNGRTYIFSRDIVYEMWRHDNLQERSKFLINNLFPKGPRTVTAAYTNSRSGVTVLIERRNVYRYRWNRETKRFFLARKSPQQLAVNITFTPHVGFQWIDNNQVLMKGDGFVIYDAYWNTASFTGAKEDYFRNMPDNMIGVLLKTESLLFIYTSSNTIQVYDAKKHKVLQEYPLQVNTMVGCERV